MPAQTTAATAVATTAGTTQAVWATWINTSVTGMQLLASTATATQATWEAWNTTLTTGTTTGTATPAGTWTWTLTWSSWNTAAEESREQRETREQAAAQAQEAAKAREAERMRKWEAAKARALELLSFCLTADQMASYREKGWFEVRGSRGRRWRIRARGQSGNVDLMPEIGDERLASYCAHPPGRLPDPDAHLAQMLALVTDEDEFERVANIHYRRQAA